MNNSSLKTLEILELISESKKPLGISDISSELGYPKSSVFDIISALAKKNFIEQTSPEIKTYKIGFKMYQIGSKYIHNTDLYLYAHDVLTDISSKTGETVYLAIEQNGFIIYLDKVESEKIIRTSCNIGSTNYLHLTGLGKAILAGYSDEKIKELTDGKFIIRTSSTIKDYDSLMVEIEKIRSRGYAFDNGEDNEMVRCIASPVRDASGAVVAAISVSMLQMDFTPEKIADSIDIITKSALFTSRKLGYMGNFLYPQKF